MGGAPPHTAALGGGFHHNGKADLGEDSTLVDGGDLGVLPFGGPDEGG